MEIAMKPRGRYGRLWTENWSDLEDAIDAHAEEYLAARAVDRVLGCDLIWPLAGKLRVRRVVSRRGRHITGKYPSMKAGRMVQWESSSERALVKLLELCPAVSALAEQPVRIRYRTSTGLYSHVPDFFIWYGQRRLFVEVKEEAEAHSPEILERTRGLIPALGAHGFGYVVLTERVIRREPRLTNARTLVRLGRTEVSTLERERVRRQLRDMGRAAAWGGLCAANLRCQAARLILQGDIEMPVNQALNDETPVYWRNRRA